jgi:hypothetical protein
MRSLVWVLLFVTGCTFAIPSGKFECDVDLDCPGNHHCSAGLCVAGTKLACDDHADCPETHYCRDAFCEFGTRPECDVDLDCPWAYHCSEGACIFDCASAGSGDQIWELTALNLPAMGEVIGFDLDDHYTTDSEDPIGCGHSDLEGGVDNMLAGFLGLLTLFDADLDMNALVAEAIADGTISITVILTGYGGLGDDQALISLNINGVAVEGLQGICMAVNSAGDLVGYLPTLPLALPEISIDPELDPIALSLDLSNVRIRISNPSGNDPASAIIGGEMDGEVFALAFAEWLGPELSEIADVVSDLASSFLDLGDPGACDMASVGLGAEFARVPPPL